MKRLLHIQLGLNKIPVEKFIQGISLVSNCIRYRLYINKIKMHQFSCCTIFILMFSSCISLYYAPNSQNVPLFTGKNETEASLAIQFGSLTLGCDIDLAYSVTNHLGLMANYNHWGAKKKSMLPNSDVEFEISGKSDLFELGAGYFLPFRDKFVFEVYGGMGWGGVKNEYESSKESKLTFNRYFLQPSCGYYNKKVNLAFSLRLSGVDYKHFKFDPGVDTDDKSDLQYIMDSPFAFYLEPAFTFRVGGEYLKFQFQVAISENLNNPDLVYEPLCITAGLIAIFPNKKEKTKNQNDLK
jgi:hypothetical protein